MSNLGEAADVNPANSKTQNAFLLPVHAMFRHDCPLAVKPARTPRRLLKKKNPWRDFLPIDMLLSAASVLVVAQTSSEVPEGLMNCPVLIRMLMIKGELLSWIRTDCYSLHYWALLKTVMILYIRGSQPVLRGALRAPRALPRGSAAGPYCCCHQ